MLNDTLIVIPVRMGASRFPGKPLIDINGKAMVLRVWEKAVSSKCGDVLVACCDNQVKEYLIDKYPIADDILNRHLALPMYVEMTLEQVDIVCNTIKDFIVK